MTVSITLSPKQEQFVYSRHAMTAMLCGRAFGKSTCAAYLVCNRITRGQSVLVVAPTYSMLRNSMIRMVQKTLGAYGYIKGKHYSYNGSSFDLELYAPDKSVYATVYFRSGENFEAIRSVTDVSALIVDEAALISSECFEIAMACVRAPGLENPQYFLISTPRGRANYMSDIFLDAATLAIKGTSYDNPFIGKASIDNLVKRYGPEFARQEIYADIMDSTSSGYFRTAEIDTLNTMTDFVNGDVVFGFDIAGEGDDFSAITVIHGNRIIDMSTLKTPDDITLKNYLQFKVSQYPTVRKIFIDKTGAGHIVRQMERMFPDVETVGVHFSERAYKTDTFANQRAEMYDSLRERIRKEHLHFDQSISAELREMVGVELYATEFSINNARRIQLREKKEIKKALGRSPDIADSLALACINSGRVTQAAKNNVVKHLLTPKKLYPNRKN